MCLFSPNVKIFLETISQIYFTPHILQTCLTSSKLLRFRFIERIISSKRHGAANHHQSIKGNWLVLFVNHLCGRLWFFWTETTPCSHLFSKKLVWETCGVCIPRAKVLIWFSSPGLAESCWRIHMRCCKHWLPQALWHWCIASQAAINPFTNKLHKALWCLNIYGCLSFPWGLFSVKVPTALSHVEWLQTSYLGVRVKGLVVWTSPPEEELTGRKGH